MSRFRFSISELQEGLKNVASRFPIAILFCLLGLFAGIQLIDNNEMFVRLLLISVLALPSIVAVVVFAESFNWSNTLKYGLQVFVMLLLTVYYYLLPENFDKAPTIHLYRFLGISFAAHLLVAISVLGFHNRQILFWYFNQYLFFRWLQASLFSAVLYSGLAGALAAIHFLFNVDFDDKIYGYLFAFIACLFHPLYFLAGVPRMQHHNDEVQLDYPKQLNVFSIYILLPIVLIYLIILYAYGIKIVGTWTWPSGWVGWLVLGFSVSGIFAWLLVYPLQQTDKQNLAKLYFNYYFTALIPVLFLLYMAIYKRLDMYGFTEDRYIIFVLAIWLTIVALYSIIKKDNIIFIPASLLVITMLSIIGPWSMFAVSKRAQWNRLMDILERNQIVTIDQKIQKPDTTLQSRLSINDRFEITSISQYICEMHGIDEFGKIFLIDLDTVKNKSTWWQKDFVLEQIGIQPQYSKEFEGSSTDSKYFNFSCKSDPVNIQGYQYIIKTSIGQYSDNEKIRLNADKTVGGLLLQMNAQVDTIRLKDFIKNKLNADYYRSFNPEEMTISIGKGDDSKRLVFLNIAGNIYSNEYDIYNAEVLILYNK